MFVDDYDDRDHAVAFLFAWWRIHDKYPLFSGAQKHIADTPSEDDVMLAHILRIGGEE